MYTQYRARKPVQVNPAQVGAIQALQQGLPKLGNSDSQFAASLLQNFTRYGNLSDKQMNWVTTLTQRALAPKPVPVALVTVNFQPIQDLFDKAAQKLKRIKVKLQTADGQPVVISRAGPMSKYTGQILITDGGPFGDNKFFGRIDTTGEFFATRSATPAVAELIKQFSEDPAASAAQYGKLTGGCSFCKHGLTDNRSLAVGYGPVCAKNFGLVWG
jgi:hypothetical protein